MTETAKRRETPMGKPVHIALAFPISRAHLHLLARGITDFAKSEARWLLTTGGEAATLSVEQLRGWKGQGIIAGLVRPSEVRVARAFVRKGIPVVTIAGAIQRHSGIPRVMVENSRVGELAAEHLLACGFQRFACYGLKDVAYSTTRVAGFARRLRKAGFGCAEFASPHTYGRNRPWQDEVFALQRWLSRQKLPLGVFAVNDYRGRLVIDACALAGLRVPDEMGIVGVDNDRVTCEFSEPQLSSIACDWYRVGQEAARTLHALMTGKSPVAAEQMIPPLGVVARASTNVRIAEDADVLRALKYIREHVGESFGVERLLAVCGISRRKLEQAFRAEVGMSPYRYLSGQRVQQAKGILRSEQPARLSDISRACGFHDLRRFRLVFRRITGITPAQYRRGADAGSGN